MLFSIIIPVYNIEKYLKKCVNRILCQTFTDYEILLIDDGSTDRSGQICDTYARNHHCIKVIHQKNHGQACARNRGIMISQGDYILFLDGDDYWYGKDSLHKLAHCISRSDGRFDIIAFRCVSAYSDGKRTVYSNKHMNHWITADDLTEGWEPQHFLNAHLKQNPMLYWYPWQYAYSRKLFADRTLRFPNHRKYEDVYFTWRILLKACRIGLMPDKLYVYRQGRPGSTTQTESYQSLIDFLWIINKNISDVEQMDLNCELKKRLLNNFSRNYYLCCTLSTYLNKRERNIMLAKLKRKQRLMDYANEKKYVLARCVAKIIGLQNMSYLLHLRSLWLRQFIKFLQKYS